MSGPIKWGPLTKEGVAVMSDVFHGKGGANRYHDICVHIYAHALSSLGSETSEPPHAEEGKQGKAGKGKVMKGKLKGKGKAAVKGKDGKAKGKHKGSQLPAKGSKGKDRKGKGSGKKPEGDDDGKKVEGKGKQAKGNGKDQEKTADLFAGELAAAMIEEKEQQDIAENTEKDVPSAEKNAENDEKNAKNDEKTAEKDAPEKNAEKDIEETTEKNDEEEDTKKNDLPENPTAANAEAAQNEQNEKGNQWAGWSAEEWAQWNQAKYWDDGTDNGEETPKADAKEQSILQEKLNTVCSVMFCSKVFFLQTLQDLRRSLTMHSVGGDPTQITGLAVRGPDGKLQRVSRLNECELCELAKTC